MNAIFKAVNVRTDTAHWATRPERPGFPGETYVKPLCGSPAHLVELTGEDRLTTGVNCKPCIRRGGPDRTEQERAEELASLVDTAGWVDLTVTAPEEPGDQAAADAASEHWRTATPEELGREVDAALDGTFQIGSSGMLVGSEVSITQPMPPMDCPCLPGAPRHTHGVGGYAPGSEVPGLAAATYESLAATGVTSIRFEEEDGVAAVPGSLGMMLATTRVAARPVIDVIRYSTRNGHPRHAGEQHEWRFRLVRSDRSLGRWRIFYDTTYVAAAVALRMSEPADTSWRLI